jgi:hypothetical protein
MTSGLVNLNYTVTAEDTLDGTGSRESLLEDNEHRVVALTLESDPCTPSNTVHWTGYMGWEGNISGYKIYGGITGSVLQMLKFVHANTRFYEHKGINVDSPYSYYVEAVHTSGMVSHSPIDTVIATYPEAPEFLQVDYVSVVDRSEVELQFSADVEGEVNSFRVMKRSSAASPFAEVESVLNTIQSTHVVTDRFPNANTSFEYIVESIYQPGSCTSPIVISSSNLGTSMLLESTLEGQVVTLEWTPYREYVNGLSGYVIQRKSGSGEFFDVQTLSPETTRWSESIQSVVNGFQPGQLQYKILAVENPGGIAGTGISVSNIVSVAVETHLMLPSAFTPGSNDMNFEFKPLIDFAPRSYVMIIYDRVGRKLFETEDPGLGWDGSFRGGDYVMEGVYVYYVQYTDYTGILKSVSGNVTVLYP